MGRKTDDPFKGSKLFSQKAFKKAVKDSEHPDFDVNTIFDTNYKEGKKIKVAPKEKKKAKEKLSVSFGDRVNKTYYNYNSY